MIFYLLLGLLLFWAALQIGKFKDEFAPAAGFLTLFCSFIILSWWFYAYFYLPGEAAQLYNGGQGVMFVNGTNNVSLYSSTDPRLLYSIALQQDDWSINDLLKSFVWLVGIVAVGGYGLWWMVSHNLFGRRLGGESK